jgi:hypothetical protein
MIRMHVCSCVDAQRRVLASLAALAVIVCALLAPAAHAIPLFNRQTGQNCVACHAGGQFPELTPYGRLFKMTGYTIGQRTLPLSVMGVASYSKVADTAKSDDPGSDFQKNGVPIFATGSVFIGGKVTDNFGAFVQVTYDRYASRDDNLNWHSHTNADNIDLRYADRFIDAQRDLIVGASLNNNPSVADPWNTAAAWMQYVPVPSPTSSQFIDGNAPYPGFAAGGNTAGLTAYAFWNKLLYAELGAYRTANGALRFMSAGVAAADRTALQGLNPYWRVALNHEWGAHSLMIGTSGMTARIYDDPLDTGDPATLHRFRDFGVDAMYQYLLDPHSITAQFARARRLHRYPAAGVDQPVAFVDAAGNPLPDTSFSDSTTVTRLKLTYVFAAKYGGSIGFFDLTGTVNTANLTAGFDPATLTVTSDPAAAAPSTRVTGNRTGKPDTRGWTLEAFWTPVQYLRVGAQYTAYDRVNGLSSNYDGFGRNAGDNNTLFVYVWGAY